MNAPCFPRNPAWARTATSPFILVKNVVFLVSGLYLPSPGLMSAEVQCIGAGGAGGWCAPYPGKYGAAGGGGSGGRSISALPAAFVLGGVNVTVGLGNYPVAALTPRDPDNPQYAASTTFGTLVTALGGGDGWPYDPQGLSGDVMYGDGGYAQGPGTGDVFWSGTPGMRWTTVEMPQSGATPPVPYGQGGRGGFVVGGTQGTTSMIGSADGLPGYFNSGAGGAGGESNYEAGAQPTRIGGRGSDGICIVTEIVSACGCGPGCGCGCGSARVSYWGCE